MQQVKRTHAVRCPVCGKGRVIDAAADVDPGRLQIGISFEKAGHS